ncbi:MAG: hypothetical protein NTW97_03355 [Candidatus Krumholzibacteria bacterium]|nr:hypothetical protein [Candidatus Krumholzibacteria bacterium]
MNAYELIRKKRSGLPLDETELRWLVGAYLRGDVRDYQMAAFLMAIAINGMTAAETVALTRVMMESGRIFDFGDRGGAVIDKHSTGGVGDKVSIPLVPIAAACGLRVPMLSGRSLGATGGHARQARVDPRNAHRDRAGPLRSAGRRAGGLLRGSNRRDRPGRSDALCPARRVSSPRRSRRPGTRWESP